MKKVFALFVCAAMLLSLAAVCGAESGETAQEESGYPVTVSTYSMSSDGAVKTAIEETFESAPERVFCNCQGAAELMIRLGLADKIVGVAAVFGTPAEDVAEEFEKLTVVSTGYASKELALSVNPDCMIGRPDLFIDGDYGIGTVTDLNNAGIKTYTTHVDEENATYESFLLDIENLGKIFGVEERAAELIEYYRNLINDMKTDERWAGKSMVMVPVGYVQDGVPYIYGSSTEYIQNEAYEMVNIINAYKDDPSAQISVETMIETNPDVIVLFDYEGGPDMDEMINGLYANESLQQVSAIQNKQIYSLDFNAIYGGGGDLYTAVYELAEQVYGE